MDFDLTQKASPNIYVGHIGCVMYKHHARQFRRMQNIARCDLLLLRLSAILQHCAREWLINRNEHPELPSSCTQP